MEDYCETVKTLAESIFLRTTLIFILATSLVALPLVVVASYSLTGHRVSKLIHVNTVIIFQTYLFGFFLHCFSRIVLHSLDLYNYAAREDCDMAPSTLRCFIFRVMFATGFWMVCATPVPLVIERFIATKKSSSYEHKGCLLGFSMLVLQISLACLPTWFSFRTFSFEKPAMAYCIATKPGSNNIGVKISGGGLAVQIVCRICFHFFFKINEKLRKKQLTSSLSNRYSLEQNMRVIQFLKNFANLQASFMIIHLTLLMFLVRYGLEMETPIYLSLVELDVQYPLYAIVSIALYLKWRNSNRVRVKQAIRMHVKIDQMNHQDVYFANFNKDLR